VRFKSSFLHPCNESHFESIIHYLLQMRRVISTARGLYKFTTATFSLYDLNNPTPTDGESGSGVASWVEINHIPYQKVMKSHDVFFPTTVISTIEGLSLSEDHPNMDKNALNHIADINSVLIPIRIAKSTNAPLEHQT
jgi:hypothetical protein